MADEGEVIGGVRIVIRGDFTQLEADFQAAVADSRSNGASMAQAISQAFDTLATHGELASYQIKQVGASLASIAPAAQAASAGMAGFNAELGATGESAEVAGGSLRRLSEESGTTFRSMVSDLRFWSRSIFILMAPQIVAGLVEGVVNFFKKQNEAIHDSLVTWREFNGELEITDAELQVSNDKLANQIAKLEGQPQNGLKLALDEATLSAERLSEALNKDLDAVDKLLEKQDVHWWDKIFGGPNLSDLREKLRFLQDTEGDAKTAAGQLRFVQDEIDATKRALLGLQQANDRPSVYAEPIQAATEALKHFEDQLKRVQDEQKHADLSGHLAEDKANKTKPDKDKKPQGYVIDLTGELNEYQIAVAVAVTQMQNLIEVRKKDLDGVTAYVSAVGEAASVMRAAGEAGKAWAQAIDSGSVILRKAGESTADWDQRIRDTFSAVAAGVPELSVLNGGLKSVDQQVKEGAADFKDMREILASQPSAIQAASQEWKNFDKALRDLHLHDTAEQLQTLSQDLVAIAAHSGTASKDYAEGWKQYTEALAKAAQETGSFNQQLAAGAFQQIPQMFNGIESQLSSLLFKWKDWGQSIEGIFRKIGESGLTIILHTLLQPIQTALQKLAGEVLGSLSSAFSSGAGAAAAATLVQVKLAAGEAYAWTYASVSAIPIVGPALAPEAASGAYAAVLAGAAIGGLEEGTDFVPQTGPYILHRGERVMTKEDNEAYTHQIDVRMPTVPALGSSSVSMAGNNYQNSSVGSHFDFRGSHFTGVTSDMVSDVMNQAVKKMRRSNVNI